jgi:hypothetical protein
MSSGSRFLVATKERRSLGARGRNRREADIKRLLVIGAAAVFVVVGCGESTPANSGGPVATPTTVATTPTARPTAAPTAQPTPRPTAAPNTCGAPANPFGYDFCGGGVIASPPSNFCDYFNCIPSFWNSTNGYVEECADATYSHSGGRSGSCSSHGGNRRPLNT